MNAYETQKFELISLGLLIGPIPFYDQAAKRGYIKSKEGEIQAARAAYLEEHGPEVIKAKFPRFWQEVWPNIK